MANTHGKQIKDGAAYQALRAEGNSKEKSARIANAQANPVQKPSQTGGEEGPYENRTLDELFGQAKKLRIPGRSGMNKEELIDALRNH